MSSQALSRSADCLPVPNLILTRFGIDDRDLETRGLAGILLLFGTEIKHQISNAEFARSSVRFLSALHCGLIWLLLAVLEHYRP